MQDLEDDLASIHSGEGEDCFDFCFGCGKCHEHLHIEDLKSKPERKRDIFLLVRDLRPYAKRNSMSCILGKYCEYADA